MVLGFKSSGGLYMQHAGFYRRASVSGFGVQFQGLGSMLHPAKYHETAYVKEMHTPNPNLEQLSIPNPGP